MPMTPSPPQNAGSYFAKRSGITFFGLCLLLSGYYFGRQHRPLVSPLPSPVSPVAADQVTNVNPGPWGNLECIPIYIEPPDDYLPVQKFETQNAFWFFPDYTSA